MKCKINLNHKISNFLFLISYVLFVFSLFNRDVSDINVFYSFTIFAKYISLVLLLIGILLGTYTRKEILRFIFLLCIDLILLIKSGVLVFIIISLFAFHSTKIKDDKIIKLAYYTLLIFTAITFLLLSLGIFKDGLTSRWVGDSARHTLGFYHSNVLPLIYSYLVGYGLSSGIYKKNHYMFLIIMNFMIYYLCGSRNVLVATLILIGSKWFVDSFLQKSKFKKIINNILCVFAKIIIPFLSMISLIVPLLMDHIVFFQKLDFILSYRFTAIYKIIQTGGIHLITQMTNEMYFDNKIVIDNGYAFLAIRYGIVMLIFLSVITYCIANKYRDNTFVLILIIIVACINFIDNDIIDYSCLPYLIIGEKYFLESFKRRKNNYE